jgi:hypothetical protein
MAPSGDEAACVANIGPKGRRRRLEVGLVGMAFSLVATAVVVFGEASPLFAIAVIPLWWVSALGLFQAREQTCVALAARGQRDLDGGAEALPPAERDAVQQQARRVHLQAFAFTVVIVAASVLVRSLRARH